MQILNPLGLLALCSIPLLYLLAVVLWRPPQLVVSSLLIWKKLPRPEPAQLQKAKKRITLSFILLAAGLACVSLGLSRPVLTGEDLAVPKLVVALDTSASMLTRRSHSGRTRWEEAVEDLDRLFMALPPRTEVVLLTDEIAGPILRLKAAERGRLEEFVRTISPRDNDEARGQRSSNLDGLVNRAIQTAQAFGTRDISVFSDRRPNVESAEIKIKYALYGDPSGNIGIVRVTASPSAGEAADCLVAVQNFSTEKRSVELAIVEPVDAVLTRGTSRVVLNLDPLARVEHVFEGVRVGLLDETRLAFQISPLDALGDDLDLDNTAYGQFIASTRLRVCLVSPGNSRLERAFLATEAAALEIKRELHDDSETDYCLVVFDRVVPARMPSGAVVLIAPLSDCPPFRFGAVNEPQGDVVVAQHELMRDVRLENIRFRRARKLELMPEAPGRFEVLASQGDMTLVALYEDDLTGQWLLAIPFDISWRGEESDTDWATQPAFPIFWMNVVEYVRARRDKDTPPGRTASFVPLYGRCAGRDASHVFFADVLGEDESQNGGVTVPFAPEIHARLESPQVPARTVAELSPWLLILSLLCLLLGWRAA